MPSLRKGKCILNEEEVGRAEQHLGHPASSFDDFKEVIGDVLKVKPPVKPPKKRKRKSGG